MIVTGRRRFLSWLAAGAAATGVGVAKCSGYRVPSAVVGQLRTLEPWQYVVIDAFGRRILNPEQADVGAFADQYMAGLAADDLRDLLRFAGYLEHVAPLSVGRLRRFSSLSSDAQDSVLRGLEHSNLPLLRAGFQGLKALSIMALYRRDDSWSAIAYPGPVVDWGEP